MYLGTFLGWDVRANTNWLELGKLWGGNFRIGVWTKSDQSIVELKLDFDHHDDDRDRSKDWLSQRQALPTKLCI